jgi:DNA-binding winged helix-turn-helix (wHTH) protein
MAHGDRSVDVFVRKVRQKLERVSPDWNYIHTHFGVGYRFDPERRDGADPEPQLATIAEPVAEVAPPLADIELEPTRIDDDAEPLHDESAALLAPER